MTWMRADIEGSRIILRFPYSSDAVWAAKRVPGGRFDPKRKVWSYPLSLKTARILAETFGSILEPSDDLKRWSKKATREEARLRRKATANDSQLTNLSDELMSYLKPYQRADVAFMAERSCINANQAGLGKTVEVIAASLELNRPELPNLVVSPVTSLEAVWQPAIEQLDSRPVYTGTTTTERKKAMDKAKIETRAGRACWVCINPELVKRDSMAWAATVRWGAVVVDEFHTMGLAGAKTQLTQALRKLSSERRWPLSGSPIAGVPLNFWSALNWVDPKAFPSQWAWAQQWFDSHVNHFGTSFGDIQPGREAEFYRTHAPWLIRRIKSEVAPELPPKIYRDVWVKMRPAQEKQYRKFEQDAEIRLSGQSLIGTTKLAEYQRLKFFAFGSTKMHEGLHVPTEDSPKIDQLCAKIDHHLGESQLVFTQSKRVANIVTIALQRKKYNAEILSGDTKNRAPLIELFQAGGFQIFVIVTKAAGVSITLDKADVVHILDQTWNPDDQEQAEDRAHRANRGRTNHVVVYYYRTRDTIEEQIANLNLEKTKVNVSILDLHRQELIRRRDN